MSEFWSFSSRDLLRGTVVPPSWYRVRIESITPGLSKDGQSTNYTVEGTIIYESERKNAAEEKISGVPITWNFNSKALGFAVGFLKMLGFEPKPGERVDYTAAVGKDVDVFVDNKVYEGRILNNVPHQYRPAS